jgi:hypothetical protein
MPDAAVSRALEIVIGEVVLRDGSDVEPDRLANVFVRFARHDRVLKFMMPARRSADNGAASAIGWLEKGCDILNRGI